MPWYFYKSGGWEVAVDAMNKLDADHTVSIQARGAKYVGEFTPPSMQNPSPVTAIVSARRQEQISERIRRENMGYA